MKNKKIKKPSKKLIKSSKILIGTTTALATATAVVVPIVVSNNNKKNKVEDNNKKVNAASFASLDKNNLPSSVTKTQIKALEGLNTLEDDDIALNPNNDNGNLKITITNHGPEKVFNLSGFETTASQALQALKTKVQSLNEDSFASLDKNNLPSAVTKTQIKALEGLNTLEDDDIALNPNNDNGNLKITITNHGPEKVINLSGFETTASQALQALKTKVQSLNEANFASLDKNNLPSAFTKTQIKALEGLITLEDDDIALTSNNDNGTLQVIITNHGPEKVINLSGFETTASQALQALKTKVQSLNETSFASLDKNNLPSAVTKTQIKTLEGLTTLEDDDIALNPNNDNGNLKITITNHGPEKVFNLSGFETTASQALQALKTKVQSLNEDSFASLDKNNLPSAVTKTQIKALEGLNTLEDDDIALNPNNDNGNLKITITNHGPEKVINLSGFETTASQALQALKTKVQSLNEANFASLDKNNLPSAVTKENVKALEDLTTLEDDDIALNPSDDNGTLQVTITNHGPEKVFNLSGFETTASQALQALKTKVQSLNETSFASLDKNNLPSAVTKTQIKALEGLNTLEDDDIALNPNNDNGNLKITITNHGPEKVFNLSGFETTASQALQALKTKVQSLNEDSFASLDKNNLPSAVTKENVKALEDLTTLEDDDIALNPSDDNGTLQVTITNHGPEKVINLSGFETTASQALQALKTKVQSLNETSFASLDKNNLPSSVTKTQIKALEGLNTLEDDDIALTSNNDNGTLQVIITNHGPEKVINLTGFETTASQALQALKTKVQSLNEDSFASLDRTNLPGAVTKTQIKALEGLITLEDEDIALTPSDDNGTLQVIITNHGPEKVINLSDFPKKADLEAIEKISKTLEETQYTTEDDGGTDYVRYFANDFTNLQKNAETKNIYLEWLKLIKKYKSSLYLKSLPSLPEGYTYKITNKMQGDQNIKTWFYYQDHTIYVHELKFEILKNGFVYKEFTKKIEIALLTLKTKVQSLNEASFASLDKTNLPSAVTKTQIKTLEGLITLEDDDIALNPNNDNGTLQVIITNHGPEKVINLSGFETTASQALQALKTKVQSLNEANFASLDKNNLPSAVTKTQIKALEGLTTLEDQDIALNPNNDNGNLKITITNHGPEKVINLSGFETTKSQALKTKVQSLKVANFASLDKNNLPSAVTKTQIKALEGLTTLEDDDIALNPNNDNGNLKITITNHGPEKVINLSGFETTKSQALKTKVQSLNEDSFASLDKTNLPSAVTKTQIKTLEGLNTLEDDDIALNPNNDNGNLKITITNHGPEKVINLSGFETTKSQALKTKVQSLKVANFASLDKNNLPSAVTKTQIKALEGLTTLEDDDIALNPNNDNGNLKITITNHGPEKVINLSDFPKKADLEAIEKISKTLEETQYTTEDDGGTDYVRYFANDFTNLQKNAETKNIYLEWLKLIKKYKSSLYLKSLPSLPEGYTYKITNKMQGDQNIKTWFYYQDHTIYVHELKFEILKNGFVYKEFTKKIEIALLTLKTKVQSLNEDSFASLDKTNLPSAVTKTQIKTLEGLNTLEDQDIALNPNNDNGNLKITITNHGPEKIINLSGFETTASQALQALKTKVQSLNEDSFASLDKNNLPSAVTKTQIKALEGLNTLEDDDIALNPNNDNGNLKITITNHGPEKVINLSGFETTASQALQALKTKVQSLNEANFASLDKNNLPSAVTKENVKALEDLTTLEDDDIALNPSDDNGTLQVTITNHGPEKVINLSGFETTASQALKTKVQSLNAASFASLDKNNLPSAFTKTQIKALEGLITLEDDDIALTSNNDNGTLQVIITNHGPEKVINLSGFETTASQALQALKTKVQSLNETSFASLDKNNLPSSVTKTQIKALEGLITLEDEDIALTPSDDNGTLQVIITNHGPEKVINLSGFETTASQALQALKTKVQSLNETSFASLDKNNLPSSVTKTQIKALEGLNTLEDDDIALTSNNDNGTLQVIITNHGPEKVINLTGFETTASQALQALKTKVQSLNEDSFASLDRTNLPGAVTKTQIKALEGLITLEDQDIALTPSDDNGTLQVIITNHGPEKVINLSDFPKKADLEAIEKISKTLEETQYTTEDDGGTDYVRYFANDFTNLQKNAETKNIYLEWLKLIKKYKSSLYLKSLPSLPEGYTYKITNKMQGDQNIKTWFYYQDHTIYVHELKFEILKNGFVYKEFTKKIEIALLTLKTKVQSLNEASFASLDKTNLPSAVTKTQIKTLEGLITLEDDDIALNPNNDNGTLQVIITNHGPEKVINLSGFETTASQALQALKTKVQSLNEANFASLDKNNLPSAVTKTQIKTLEGLNTLEDDDIALNPNNDNGNLKITITNHGPEKVINLSGFETTKSQALKTKVQSLKVANFASLDKNNLPSAVTKTQIKALEGLTTLEDDDIALNPNNDNGNLKITITNHGPEKVINLSDFPKKADLEAIEKISKTLEETQYTTEDDGGTDYVRYFANDFTNLQKNAETKNIYLEWLKLIKKYKSSLYLKSLPSLPEGYTYKITNKMQGDQNIKTWFYYQDHTIYVHELKFEILKNGFVYKEFTKKIEIALLTLKTKVQSLNEDSFASLDKTNLPSAVTKTQIKTLEGLNTLEDQDIALNPNNDNGNLKITITNHGPEKIINLSGFETTASQALQALKTKVQSLNEANFASLDKNNLPSAVTKTQIKALEGLTTLEDQDIALNPNNDNGTLQVIITNHGPEKIINLSDFPKKADLAAAKLANDKNVKKAVIDNINPQSTLMDGATNPTEDVNALDQAKTAANDAIQNSSSSADLSSIFNTQKAKVETARDAAEQAIQAANLAFTKTRAKDAVNTEYAKASKTKDTDGKQELFDSIKEAKDKALTDIQNTNTREEINQTKEDALWAIKEAINIFNKYLEIRNQSDIFKAQKIAKEIIADINVGIDLLPGVELPFWMQYALNRSKQDAINEIILIKLDKAAVIDCLNKNLPLVKEARDTLKQAIRKTNAVKRIFDRPQDENKKPLMLDDFLPKVNNDYQDISSQELKEKFNLEDVASDYKLRYKVTKVDETKDEVLVTVELTSKIDNSFKFKIIFTKKGLPTTSSLISKIWDPRFKTYRDEKSLKLPSASNHKNTTLGFYIKNKHISNFKDFILSKYTIEISSLNDDKKNPLPLFNYGGLVNWHIPLNNKKWIEILTRIMETRSGIKDFRDIFEINIKNQDMTHRNYLGLILKDGSPWKGVAKFYKQLVFTIIDKSNNKVLYDISLDNFYVINDDPFI